MSDCGPQELEVERLRNRIMRMETIIKELLHYTAKVEAETGQILGQSSGVPRGKWSFAKGADRIARDVRRFLERGLLC